MCIGGRTTGNDESCSDCGGKLVQMTNMSAVASAAEVQRRGLLRPYIVNGREVDVNHVTGVP